MPKTQPKWLQSKILNIGFDDTDSPKGMCTTYLAYKIVDTLKKEDADFVDYPRLIRFNPNIPWKTRGNGAVGIKIKTKHPDKIKKIITHLVKKYSDLKNGANPGLVFCEDEKISEELKKFSKLALWQLINRNLAKKIAKKNNLETYHLGNGQGLVGAIGAIAYDFDDYTLELLSYRKKNQFGRQRQVSKESVKLMQEKTFPQTFNSFDTKRGRVLITPRGPDPVFYGIRGEDPQSLLLASRLIKTKERLDGYMLFRSNQGTAAHLQNKLDTSTLKPYSSGILEGTIVKKPTMVRGGHVFLSIRTDHKVIECAVYKPTGLGKTAMQLAVGDRLQVGGGIRKSSKIHPRVMNVEFISVLKLVTITGKSNPFCKRCSKKMKSKGKNQGFECIKCGRRSSAKTISNIPRKIQKRMYLPQISAHRHLTRPQQRVGRVNQNIAFSKSIKWFDVFKN